MYTFVKLCRQYILYNQIKELVTQMGLLMTFFWHTIYLHIPLHDTKIYLVDFHKNEQRNLKMSFLVQVLRVIGCQNGEKVFGMHMPNGTAPWKHYVMTEPSSGLEKIHFSVYT